MRSCDWNVDTVLSAGGHMFSTVAEQLRVGGDVSGGADGETTLTVAGHGQVWLSGADTFAGDLRVTGDLDVRAAEALPASAAVTVAAGGTLGVRQRHVRRVDRLERDLRTDRVASRSCRAAPSR